MLAFLLLLSASVEARAAVTIDRLEASVNASLILLSDVRKFRQTMPLRSQLDPLFAGTAVASQGNKATDADIVQFLVDERLIAQQFPVTDSEVEQEINSIQANNKIDRGALKAALQEQGFTFEDYFELIRTSAAKRNLIDRDIRTKVSISDDDVKNYFYNHYSKSSSTPLAYRVRIITVSPSNYKSAGAAKEIADRALREIRAGEPFEEVAKRVSDDGSASSGGDLGTLTDDQMSPAIKEQLKKLQIGQVSEVLGSASSRYFILKLVDVSSGEGDRFEKMKEEIRNQLATSEYQHQITLWLDRQRQGAFIHRAGAPSVTELPSAR
jgi:peptidyl-prolyl cis-trans isomerase SurA